MIETWLPVLGYEGLYEASSFGRVRSIDRIVSTYSARAKRIAPMRRKGVMLIESTPEDGYPRVSLSKNGKSKTLKVSTIVCRTFHGARPDGMQACHGDGDRSNNRPDNLRWGTAKENQDDRKAHGTDMRGEEISTSKYSQSQVEEIKLGLPFKEANKKFGISRTQFHRIKKGEAWAHV